MLINKIILAGLLLLAAILPAAHADRNAFAAGDAPSVAAMKQAAKGFEKLADMAKNAGIQKPCGTSLGPLAHQIRLIRADVERSGEVFSDQSAKSSPQGQNSGLYSDAMDSLSRLAATVDDLFLLAAEMIVACADPKGAREAAELKGELAKEAEAASGEAMQAAKLQAAYLFAYGAKPKPAK